MHKVLIIILSLCLSYSQGLSIQKFSNLQTRACWQLVKSACSGRRVWGIRDALTFFWPLKTFRQGAYRLSAMIYVCKDQAERRKRLQWAANVKCWNSYKIKSCREDGRDVSSRPLALLPQQRQLEITHPKIYWTNIVNDPRKHVQRVNVWLLSGPLTRFLWLSVSNFFL